MSETAPHPDGDGGEDRTAGMSLARRFRRHANSLVRGARSPLSAQLMYDAAIDLEAGGPTARLFSDVSAPPGAVPQLRLLAALHHLVLAGRAPALAAFYPSAGGQLPPADVWPAAIEVIEQHFDWIEQRLHRTVQTNEPGRSAVLFAALLWLTDRYELPIRLLEIGASAGLNLIADRYCYLVDGAVLGDPSSPLRFHAPWRPGPPIDLRLSAGRLRIRARAGCDRHPLKPGDDEDRLTLLSYVWADELDRLERMKAALEVAAANPVPIAARPASEWLGEALAAAADGELTVIWQSVFWQYLDQRERSAIEEAVRTGAERTALVWLTMEPGEDPLAGMRLEIRSDADQPVQILASCGDHGPPVVWRAAG